MDWVKAYLSIWTELQAYIKEFHTTGLAWSRTVSSRPLLSFLQEIGEEEKGSKSKESEGKGKNTQFCSVLVNMGQGRARAGGETDE